MATTATTTTTTTTTAATKTTAVAPGPGGRSAIWPVLLTVAALAFISVRFFQASHEALIATRANACRAMTPDAVPPALLNREAPDFQLPDANGKTVSLRSQRGHPVILNFWATWCPPCVEEVPSMEELARRIEGTDVRMLAVSVDENWDLVRRFFARGTKIGVLLDVSKEVPKSYGTEKFPETFLIDASGKVRHYFINKRDWSKPEAMACLESLR